MSAHRSERKKTRGHKGWYLWSNGKVECADSSNAELSQWRYILLAGTETSQKGSWDKGGVGVGGEVGWGGLNKPY